MTNSIFNTQLDKVNLTFENHNEWSIISHLEQAAIAEEYKKLPAEEIAAFVRSGLAARDSSGLVNLIPGNDPYVPSEVRIDFCFTPSYVVCACGIYLLNTDPSALDEKTRNGVFDLLRRVFQGGIVGHGYDAPRYERFILLMFARAGARSFLKSNTDIPACFAEAITSGIDWVRSSVGQASPWTDEPDVETNKTKILEAWDSEKTRIFVYGTLMRGERAHSYLGNAEYEGLFCLRNYAIYDLGSFPGIRPKENSCVFGEVYSIDHEMLERMDRYEGEGTLYNRTTVTVNNEVRSINAFAYIYAEQISRDEIKGGKWNMRDNDKVWYACYGSNLCADRFKYYIAGGYCPYNNREYRGCTDKTLWKESKIRKFNGELYFGNTSGTWDGKGVAFFDPEVNGTVTMRLYKITWKQLLEVQKRECDKPEWYGRLVSLGTEDGLPVYTFTSEERRPANPPAEKYASVIRKGLIEECGLSKAEAEAYLSAAIRY